MDESLLHEIEPSLSSLKETFMSKIIVSHIITQNESDDIPARRIFVSNKRHMKVTTKPLSEKIMIGQERALVTLLATRQWGTRSAVLPISRRDYTDTMFDVPRLRSKFATITL